MIQGYNSRLIDLHDIARRQAYFSIAASGSKVTPQKFNSDYWPLPGEVEEKTSKTKRLLDMLKKEKERDGNRIS